MKCALFYVIQDPAKKRLNNLLSEVSDAFNFPIFDYESFPHITLKYDFEAKDISVIEKIVQNFCLTHKAKNMEMYGVGSFGRKVIYLKIKQTPSLKKIYYDLYKDLKKVKWLTWENYEEDNFRFHFTIAYKQLNERNFDSVLSYLEEKDVNLKLRFDNLAITKVENKTRKIHKLYRFTSG